MSKDEAIALTVEHLAKFNSTLVNIADLKPDFGRLELERYIFKSM